MKIKRIILNLYVKILKAFGYDLVYFIHVRKTGGTAIRNAFAEISSVSRDLVKADKKLFLMGYGHKLRLNDLDDNEFCFFAVRDPISRFISGFYGTLRSRERKNLISWDPNRLKIFKIFKTPNQLAEALSSGDLDIKSKAEEAMQELLHLKSSYWDWFISPEYLIKNKFKIRAILTQENLSGDFEKFTSQRNLNVKLPKDDVKSHKTPAGYDTKISSLAILNLKNWYEKDYQFLNILYDQKLILRKYE